MNNSTHIVDFTFEEIPAILEIREEQESEQEHEQERLAKKKLKKKLLLRKLNEFKMGRHAGAGVPLKQMKFKGPPTTLDMDHLLYNPQNAISVLKTVDEPKKPVNSVRTMRDTVREAKVKDPLRWLEIVKNHRINVYEQLTLRKREFDEKESKENESRITQKPSDKNTIFFQSPKVQRNIQWMKVLAASQLVVRLVGIANAKRDKERMCLELFQTLKGWNRSGRIILGLLKLKEKIICIQRAYQKWKIRRAERIKSITERWLLIDKTVPHAFMVKVISGSLRKRSQERKSLEISQQEITELIDHAKFDVLWS
jgi:hypothetical protein